MTTTFRTQNSTYEVDYDNKKIRRISGVNPPTAHFAPDGEWKDYSLILPHGSRLMIFWGDGDFNATMTSPLVDHS